jgi:hypothetical protein
MKTYHKIFVVLKVCIVLLFLISKLHISNYSHHLEEVVEDIFSVYVALVIIFVFWPWAERRFDKHDKMLVLSAGTLLLLTKNYYKMYDEISTLLKNFYMTIQVPLHKVYLL